MGVYILEFQQMLNAGSAGIKKVRATGQNTFGAEVP